MGTCNYDHELYHHGVLGMKWGIRRYQNKDGSLTTAGKKRAAKMKEEYTQLTGKKLRRSPDKAKELSEPKKKSVSELSDDELRSKVNRLQLEKTYLDLDRQVSSLTPKHISAGEKFVKHVSDKVIVPAMTDAGKNLLTQYLNKAGKEALGLNDKEAGDSVEALKKQVMKMNLKKQKNELNKYFAEEKAKQKKKEDKEE